MTFARGQSNGDEDGGDGEGDDCASCAGIDDWAEFKALGGGFLFVLNGCSITLARGQSNGDEDGGDGDGDDARASFDDWTDFE
jgi:alpha/beta superfamily hydrolase